MTDARWHWVPWLYEGSAAYYVRGRGAYGPELVRLLTDTLALDGRGRLLDVGCGPGRSPCPSRRCSSR